jgi:hypothetical protein
VKLNEITPKKITKNKPLHNMRVTVLGPSPCTILGVILNGRQRLAPVQQQLWKVDAWEREGGEIR